MTRETKKFLLSPGIAGAAYFLCYGSVLIALVEQWATNSMSSYGFAVPLISAYIVWDKREQLRRIPRTPDYLFGILLLALGILTLLVGRLGALMSVQGISAILSLAGLVLLVAGRDAFRVLSFAIAYLILMVPLWGFAINWVQGPSQQVATSIATTLLHVVGVPALQHGTLITLPTATIDVRPECSGINQLIALTTMTLPAAYLWLRTWRSRIGLVLFAVVLGFVSNGVRVGILAWLTASGFDVSKQHTVTHLLPGFVTASGAYLLIWGCLTLLSDRRSSTPDASPQPSTQGVVRRRSVVYRPGLEASIVVVMLFAAAAQLLGSPAEIITRSDLHTLPGRIGDWTTEEPNALSGADRFPGFDVELMQSYPTTTGQQPFESTDDELFRSYVNSSGARVRLYLGYYRNQREGKELTGIASRALQRVGSPVSLSGGEGSVTVTEVRQQQDQGERGVIYWYDINGRILPDIYEAKGYTLWDGLIRRRTNGAVVMVAWDARADYEPARQDAMGFVRTLLPVLRQFLPS